jgi:glycosyltransferase involved in cell wall biosynthesis
MVFVGDGADLSKFNTFVKKNALEEKITFMGRVVDRGAIKALMAAATLFPFPSQYDVSPLVLREAAAFSLPLLNTKDSATAFVTTNGVDGFITENSFEAFSKTLIELIGDPTLCEKVGQAARTNLYISWQDVISEVIERYTNLIERRRK